VSAYSFADVATVLPDETVLTAEYEGDAVVYRVNEFGSRIPVVSVPNARVSAMEALPDGRVLLLGRSLAPAPEGVMAARILANGTLDPTYGNAGVARHAMTFPQGSFVSFAVGPDGKLAIGNVDATNFSATRLLANGSIDTSFGSGGTATLPLSRDPRFSSQAPRLGSALVHADGRITLAGTEFGHRPACGWEFLGSNAAFARMSSSGTANAGTTGAGFLSGGLGAINAEIHGTRLDAADRVIAAGTRVIGCYYGVGLGDIYTRPASVVMRFTPSGALDTHFGNGGVVTLVSNPVWQSYVSDVQLEAGGRIIVATSTNTGYSSRYTLHALQGGGDSVPIGPPDDVDGDAAPNRVEQSEWSDPFVRDNDVFTSPRLFAMQQYRDFFGREGDAGGVDAWSGNIQSGAQSRGQVIETFFGSTEFQGTIAPVARLYFAYFLRIPDYVGLNFWTDYYRAGNSLDAISNAFAGSAEFTNTYGALDNGQFVDLVYRNVLGREPDAGGRAFWKNELDTGARTRGNVMLGFSESEEYRGSSDSLVFVTAMYVGMLRRAPEQQGFDFWVDYRNAGNSGLALIDAFLGSQEYRSRFLP
jgi:uncharacterized delta-60 repeat protein